MREDGLTLWSRSLPVSNAVFLVYRRNVAAIFQSQLDVKTCPVSVRPFFSFYFFWVHCFRLCIFFLLVSKSLRDVVAGAAPPDMKHQVSPADEPNQFASPICSSCFLSRSDLFFYLFLLFFLSPQHFKGGQKNREEPTVFHTKFGSKNHKSITFDTLAGRWEYTAVLHPEACCNCNIMTQ